MRVRVNDFGGRVQNAEVDERAQLAERVPLTLGHWRLRKVAEVQPESAEMAHANDHTKVGLGQRERLRRRRWSSLLAMVLLTLTLALALTARFRLFREGVVVVVGVVSIDIVGVRRIL